MPILVTLAGITMLVKAKSAVKAFESIVVKVSGKSMLSKEEQPLNAISPIMVNSVGKMMFFSASHVANAFRPKVVIFAALRSMLVRFLAFAKTLIDSVVAPPIVVKKATLLGTISEVNPSPSSKQKSLILTFEPEAVGQSILFKEVVWLKA